MSAIWTAGEVLIDLIPKEPGSLDRLPIVGGGPANTAKALARLGFDSYFLDGISTDKYGEQSRAELLESGVKLDYAPTIDKPTALAIVTLTSQGSASYEFELENTATFDFNRSWLPNPSLPPAVLHVGTLGTLIEPGASVLFEWASEVDAPIVYDPNIRTSILNDRDKYMSSVVKWAALASVIKMSDDDAMWLFPGRNYSEISSIFLNMGVHLVVFTKGSDGIEAFTKHGAIAAPGVKVTVVDTVGAGDTVGAILVEAVVTYGVHNLHGDVLEKTLKRAAEAAAITCSRKGANPPYKSELESC